VVDGPHRFDAVELELMVSGLAGSLRRRGIGRGDVVTWQLPNWWEALVLYRACWRCGALPAPLHHQVGASEVEAMVGVLEPAVAFAASSMPLADHQATVVVRDGTDGFTDLLSARGTGQSEPTVRPGRGDLHVGLDRQPQGGPPHPPGPGLQGARHGSVHGLSGRDAVLMPAPLAHISGLLNAVLVPGAAGMRTVLMERWDVGAASG